MTRLGFLVLHEIDWEYSLLKTTYGVLFAYCIHLQVLQEAEIAVQGRTAAVLTILLGS
jgi:hypothetical protein